MEFVEYSIPNWDSFNTKSDQLRCPSWFRVNNNICLSQSLHGLRPEEKWFFILLLAERSRKKTEIVRTALSWLSDISELDKKTVLEALEKLNESGAIAVTLSKTRSKTRSETTPTNRTDIHTNIHFAHSSHDFDYEYLYRSYPRKEGKKKGLEICRRVIKSKEDFDKVAFAIEKYKRSIKQKKTEPQFVKLFSSFMGIWTDWLDDDAGTAAQVVSNGGWDDGFSDDSRGSAT